MINRIPDNEQHKLSYISYRICKSILLLQQYLVHQNLCFRIETLIWRCYRITLYF